MYAIPIVVGGVFLVQSYFILDKKRVHHVDDVYVIRHNNDLLCSRSSVRENVKQKSKGMDEEAGKEKNDMIFTSSRDQTVVVEENPNHNQNECLNSNGGGELEGESSEGEDEDEEETRGSGDKAVEWNEDDQKNLMDLGISELERNKRLESLIARRRARKVVRTEDGKSLIDMDALPRQIVPIVISRGNPFNLPNDFNASSPIPGSAPSIMLPARNPFDLPYDPHEEKPVLTGDSFQHEFTPAHQKEFFFCRHESFSLGPSFPLELSDGYGYARFRRQSDKGDHDQLVDKILSLEDESRSQIKGACDLVGGGQAANQGSFIRSVPRNRTVNELLHESSLPLDDKTRVDDNLFYKEKQACHTPTYSIASDLQVEVSEVGSPPSTVDGTNSPPDVESLTSDMDDGEKIIVGGEQVWADSSHLSGVEENELRSREVHEVSEEDVIKVGFSGVEKSSLLELKCSDHHEEQREGNAENPVEYQTMTESEKLALDSFTNPTERDDPIAGDEDSKQSNVEIGFNDPVASTQPELEHEELSVHSSPSTSPTSVLLENVSLDQVSQSSSEQRIQIDVTQSDVDEMMENLSDEQMLKGLTPNSPRNVQPLVDDSLAHSFNNNESKTLISHDPAAELSNTAEETKSQLIEDIVAESQSCTSSETIVEHPKPETVGEHEGIILDTQDVSERSMQHEAIVELLSLAEEVTNSGSEDITTTRDDDTFNPSKMGEGSNGSDNTKDITDPEEVISLQRQIESNDNSENELNATHRNGVPEEK